jgi:hypothetical protein
MRSRADQARRRRQGGAAGLALAALLGAIPAHGADQVRIRRVTPGRLPSARLQVFFEKPAPAPATLAAARWEAVVVHAAGQREPIAVTAPAEVPDDYGVTRRVVLTLARPLTAPQRIEVQYTGPDGISALAAYEPVPAAEPPASAIAPSDSPDDSDVYLSGLVSPAKGSATTFSVDAFARYTVARPSRWSEWQVSGLYKADERPKADPDTAQLAVSFTHVGNRINSYWDAARYELERTGDVQNLLTAGRVVRPLSRILSRPLDPKRPKGGDVVLASLGLDLGLGVEGGVNLDTELPEGAASRGILRLVPSVTFSLVWLTPPLVERVDLTAAYEVRLPATDEIFLETRVDGDDPEVQANRRARHWVDVTADVMVNDYAGINVRYEYGSLPPAFSFVDHKGTLGLVIKFKWAE